MLYVYLKAGQASEIPNAFSGRIVPVPEGEVLECLDSAGEVVARFAAAEVFFYSRLRGDAEGAPAPAPLADDATR